MDTTYRNTEHMILEMLAAHRAGVSARGLAQPLGMNSDHVALIGRSLERRGLATLRGPTLVITAAGRRVLARARGEGAAPRRPARRARARPRPPGKRTVETATTEEKAVAAPRPAPRSRAAPRRAPARRRAPHPPKPQTILTDLRAMWKAVTAPLQVTGRPR